MALKLEILEGPGEVGRVYRYPLNASFVVGRDTSKSSDLPVPSDGHMSRFHFLVHVEADRCEVCDIGSSNGLFVNGLRVNRAFVVDGDLVRAGRTTVRVHFSPASTLGAGSHPKVEDRFELGPMQEGSGGVPVFRATERASGAVVALKVLWVDLDEERLRIFRRELEAAAALRHPHIVPVLAVGGSKSEVWFAVEWVDGGTLEERIDRGPLYSERQALQLGIALAGALSHAHGAGFVHRDVKPANVLLKPEASGQRAMLSDFGLAKRLDEADIGSTITSTGTIRGTPRFMPPEQLIDSRSAGPAADQFSLAASLYEVLTGAWHYDAEPDSRWRALLDGDPVPSRQRRRRLSAGLEAVLHRALSRAPEARYASMQAFRSALKDVRRSSP